MIPEDEHSFPMSSGFQDCTYNKEIYYDYWILLNFLYNLSTESKLKNHVLFII